MHDGRSSTLFLCSKFVLLFCLPPWLLHRYRTCEVIVLKYVFWLEWMAQYDLEGSKCCILPPNWFDVSERCINHLVVLTSANNKVVCPSYLNANRDCSFNFRPLGVTSGHAKVAEYQNAYYETSVKDSILTVFVQLEFLKVKLFMVL
jgi:hypothetical protein